MRVGKSVVLFDRIEHERALEEDHGDTQHDEHEQAQREQGPANAAIPTA